jgi:adenine phosphoribosyltransferase
MNASAQLLREFGADVRAGACIIELTFLAGREKLDIPFTSLIQFDE